MALNLTMEAKLGQKLVITKQLQQAIKLLQLNHQEMLAHVETAILENPTLEVVPDSAGDGVSDGEKKVRDDVEASVSDEASQSEGDGVDWEKFVESMNANRQSSDQGSVKGTIYEDLPPIETNLTYGESLADHLLFQLRMQRCGEEEARLAESIIYNLDHRGYLMADFDELVAAAEVDPEIAEDAMELVQSLDPLGCGARDLSECLRVQAKVMFEGDDVFQQILSAKNLGYIEKRNYAAIAKSLDIELEDVIEYHRLLQELEPLPGRGFSSDDARYITPDIYVVNRDGEWVVSLNEDGLPDLRISDFYAKIMSKASDADKKYLEEKVKGAEFLIRSIHKRRNTIRKVMESILKFQRDFFDRGPGHLRPLVLDDVANDVEMHMSTISRTTTNKYVHTPHGTIELKYFFSSAVAQTSGVDMAAEAIKMKIKTLVSEENTKKPLSDQAISNALKEDGVRVARRTVAKYREALGILPSSQRKKMF